MALRSSELMIGDWVFYSKKAFPYQVKLLGENLCKLDGIDNSVDLDDVHPIPLTAEILEKNGFVNRQSVTWGDVFTYTYAIVQEDKVLQYEQHFNLSPHPYDGGGFYWIPEMSAVAALRVVYVHELQHLLRLCGIEKEILCAN